MAHQEEQRYLRNLRAEGTPGWIIEDARFTEWLNEGRRTLLFSGAAGVGKTVVVSSVIDHLQGTFSAEPLIATAYVYCHHQYGQFSSRLVHVLLNLMEQLYIDLEFIPENLSDLYRQCIEHANPKEGQILRALTLVSNQYDRVFLIVDGLDIAFDSNDGRRFAVALADLQANANVNILIAQREFQEIDMSLEGVLEIQIRPSENDLEEYLKRRIGQIPALFDDKLAQHEAMTGVLKAVKQSPTFLLAHLYMELLQDCTSTAEVLDILRDQRENLHHHEGIYTRILSRIENQSAEKKFTSTCVLSWVSCTMRPLTLTELQYAITIQAERSGINMPWSKIRDAGFISSVCIGLVTINVASGLVQLIHETAKDHIDRWRAHGATRAHSEIARTCIDYLSTFKSSSADSGLAVGLCPGSFHQYATQNWGHHYRMSSVSLTSKVVDFLNAKEVVTEISRHILWIADDRVLPQSQVTGMTKMHIAAYFGLHDCLAVMIGILENLPWYQRLLNWVFGGTLGLDLKDSRGRTVLSYAAEKHERETVALLLEKGASGQLKDGNGRTPLSWAAGSDNHKVLTALLENTTVQSEDNGGRTPFSWAAGNGCLETVKLIFGTGQSDNFMAKEEDFSVRSKGLAAGLISIWKRHTATVTEDEPTAGTPLIWASSNGQIHVVEYLLSKGSDMESGDLSGRPALSWAAGNGHAAVVQSLLRHGSDVKATDKAQRDALMWAAAHGHLKVALHLLQHGACFKARDVAGRTALSLAAQNGYNALVYLFLRKDASPDIRDNEFRTPLSWAAAGGHLTSMTTLLTHHASQDQEDKYGRPPLSWAAEAGQIKAVKLLLEADANLDLTDQNGRNALSWAAGNGKADMVSIFLKIGTSSLLTSADTSGMTCLSWAARNGHSETVRLLVNQLDFDTIHAKTRNGKSAHFLACQYGHIEVVRIFLERGVFSEHDRDQIGRSALMTAASANHFEVAELLLRYKAPIDAMDFKKLTVLHHAVHNSNQKFVELFLQHGANLEIQDNLGRTPLLMSTEKHFDLITDLLLRSGARVNIQDQNGYSPLHWAARHGDLKMVQCLLRHGANVNLINNEGLTAEALVSKLNNDPEGKIQQLLRDSTGNGVQKWATT